MDVPPDLLHSMSGEIEEGLPVGVGVRAEFGGFGKMPVQFQAQDDRGARTGVEACLEKVPEKTAGHFPQISNPRGYANKGSSGKRRRHGQFMKRC